ncbi:tRNA cytidylyltransferase [Methanococcus aeolicus Nankai-3]|uniref:CCA-adding enzyme n=1 Tax=Methanococcus aeolicus (strain ATCC BAA-1280 / DSM 17508 / OCM 812 / Nankai-3) TaxID=419665 RepID=A6UWG0_META3|nr:CCA tRNA nucleotidyltransferase [Methanococcus aeolicus]ABR56832.1 tRNA cytidylyltransferase [Methanococcus aeolicus Nankai-3]
MSNIRKLDNVINNNYNDNKLNTVLNEVLQDIIDYKDGQELNGFSKKLINELFGQLKKRNFIPPVIDIIQVGSTARNTHLKNDYDIDIFVRFEKGTDKELLKNIVLECGKTVIQKLGGKCWVEYAEHPYLSAKVDKYDIDIVPCYKLEWGDKIISAVDRTPLHNEFLINKLKTKYNIELIQDIKLLKKFLKGIGVYGSDLKTKGFSGYLCELLIIYYGGFINLLKESQYWKLGQKIILPDIYKLYNLKDDYEFIDIPNQPLIVYDPTDINRNVAAALGNENFCKFLYYSNLFLKNPSKDYFYDYDAKVAKNINNRDMGELLTLVINRPKNIVEDVIYPQMEKLQNSINVILKEHDFKYIRYGNYADENYCYLSWEFTVYMLPNVHVKVGPPVYYGNRAYQFAEKYDKCFIDGCNVCAFVERKYKTVYELFEDITSNKLNNKIATPKYVVPENAKILNIFKEKYEN